MYLFCLDTSECVYEVTDSTFINNTAGTLGGGLAFNFYSPVYANNTYENNTAAYGPDMGSYAYSI